MPYLRHAALLALIWAPGSTQAQISVRPAELTIPLTPDSLSQGAFLVTNTGGSSIVVELDLADWDRNAGGDHRFSDPGTLDDSCSPGLSLTPRELRLGPGQVQEVLVDASAAESATTCWSMVFVQAVPEPQEDLSMVRILTRHGVKVYGVPPGAAARARVDSVLADLEGPDPGVRFEVLSEGNRPLRVAGVVEFRTPQNEVAARIPLASFGLLPMHRRRFQLPLPDLAPGAYVVLVVLEDGGPDLVAAQVQIQVR